MTYYYLFKMQKISSKRKFQVTYNSNNNKNKVKNKYLKRMKKSYWPTNLGQFVTKILSSTKLYSGSSELFFNQSLTLGFPCSFLHCPTLARILLSQVSQNPPSSTSDRSLQKVHLPLVFSSVSKKSPCPLTFFGQSMSFDAGSSGFELWLVLPSAFSL